MPRVRGILLGTESSWKPSSSAAAAQLRRARLEKAAGTLAALVLGFGVYYGVALSQDPSHARTLATDFDRAIVFSPWWMFAYVAVYTGYLLPLFVVRCERLFRRVVIGYLFVLFASQAVFVLMPVTTKGFRPEAAALDPSSFVVWGAAVTFTLDPPMNCFPSLHVATIVIAALCAWKADRIVGATAFTLAAVIASSTLFVKQHYAADVASGALLAVVGYFVCIQGYEPDGKSELEVRYTRWGFAGYVLVYAVVVASLFVLYRIGWKPWLK
jgi:membrane-associated phospholipid phosphatase